MFLNEIGDDDSEQKNKTKTTTWWKSCVIERMEPSGPVKPTLLLISFWFWGDFSKPSLLVVIATISLDEEEKFLNRSIALYHMFFIPATKQAPKNTDILMALCHWSFELVTIETSVFQAPVWPFWFVKWNCFFCKMFHRRWDNNLCSTKVNVPKIISGVLMEEFCDSWFSISCEINSGPFVSLKVRSHY